MGTKSRREDILIEPYKQLRFGIQFLFLNLLFSMLILGIFGYYIWDMYQALSAHFQLAAQDSLTTISKLSKPLLYVFLLIICFIILTLFLSAKYTHQIYGPMVSIRRFLDELIEGRTPSPIKLRSKDQLQDLVEKLNLLMANKPASNMDGSIAEIILFLDLYFADKKPEKIKLPSGDKLYGVAQRLNQLVE